MAQFNMDPPRAERAYRCALDAGTAASGNALADLDRAHLAYHAIFGDQSVATRIAAEIESAPQRHDDPDVTLRSHINAAEAYLYCGECRRALTLLGRIYTESVAADLPGRADAASVRAAWIARQLDDYEATCEWRSRSSGLAQKPESRVYVSHLYNEALFASDCGDLDALRNHLVSLNEAVRGDASAYHQALMRALDLRFLVTVSPKAPSPAEIDSLSQWSLRTAPVLPNDDVALACVAAWDALGQRAGREFVSKYWSLRRANSIPPLRQLASLIR